jgi:hypothetical protein
MAELLSARSQPLAPREDFTVHSPVARPRLGHTGLQTLRSPDRWCPLCRSVVETMIDGVNS